MKTFSEIICSLHFFDSTSTMAAIFINAFIAFKLGSFCSPYVWFNLYTAQYIRVMFRPFDLQALSRSIITKMYHIKVNRHVIIQSQHYCSVREIASFGLPLKNSNKLERVSKLVNMHLHQNHAKVFILLNRFDTYFCMILV